VSNVPRVEIRETVDPYGHPRYKEKALRLPLLDPVSDVIEPSAQEHLVRRIYGYLNLSLSVMGTKASN